MTENNDTTDQFDPISAAARAVLCCADERPDRALMLLGAAPEPGHLLLAALFAAQMAADRHTMATATQLATLALDRLDDADDEPTTTAEPATAEPQLIPVRPAGIQQHKVRGVGRHEHHLFETGDGQRVEVARWPSEPWKPAHVRSFDQAGEVISERSVPDVVGIRVALRAAGFQLIEGEDA